MAELLPTVFSDDEDGGGRNEPEPKATNGDEGDTASASSSSSDDGDEGDDDDGGGGGRDGDFSFGGLAGGGGADFDDAFRRKPELEWSYRSALDLLSRNDDGTNNGTTIRVERTEVSSIVAAARSNLLRRRRGRGIDRGGGGGGGNGDDDDDQDAEEGGVRDDDDDDASSSSSGDSSSSSASSDDDGGAEDAGGGGDASSDDGSDSDSSDDDDDEDDDDDDEGADVDDAHREDMEEDVLRERTAEDADKHDNKKRRKNKATNKEELRKDREDGGSDESDSGSGSSSDGDDDDEEAERRLEAKKAAAFFERPSSAGVPGLGEEDDGDDDSVLFSQLNLSRPLLRAVARMGYVSPTPVQRRCVPVVLSGRDVAASAVTGSGKTAAFLLPILERVLQRGGGGGRGGRGGGGGAIRGLVLAPTRELAAQCLSMMIALTSEVRPAGSVRGCLVVGGSRNVGAQAAELRTRPDVVCATPGRLIDHLTNSPGVHLDDLEFLVLDEADRLVDMGFIEEVKEIVRCCPVQRQTLLFSATMDHAKVDDLAVLALKRPIRIDVSSKRDRLRRRSSRAGNNDPKNGRNSGAADDRDGDGAAESDDEVHGGGGGGRVEVAPRLEQEFVRVRPGNEGVHREAMLLSLLTRSYNGCRTMVFFDTRAGAHRLRILCGLCGIRCAELHGDLTQVQRLEALEAFRAGDVDVLLATDLAGRGIDVRAVDAVLNFEMPSRVSTYVHRIGRCARAGRSGRSCTLIGEGRRHLMKEVIRDARERAGAAGGGGAAAPPALASAAVVRSRTIPPAVVAHFAAKIASLEPHVEEVLAAERVARMDRLAEMEAARAENIIRHSDEIKARPAREWFATSKQREEAQERAAAEDKKHAEDRAGTGTHRMTRKKRRAREAREEMARFQEEMRREAGEAGKQGQAKRAVTDKTIKSSARAQKKQAAKSEKESYGKSVQDDDIARVENKRRSDGKDKRKKKRLIAPDTLGSGGLFDEEKVSYAPAKKAKADSGDKPAPSNYDFRGYDPNKKFGKGGKKGNKAFKSKSKHKRR